MDAKLVSSIVERALAGARVKRPPDMSDDDWNKQDKMDRPKDLSDSDWKVIEAYADRCFGRRNDQWPWGAADDLGGRSYHESYANDWWSYEIAARGKSITVRDYQWRAPGEYFAELYAYSYFNSKNPPNGVDSALAAYMYGGKSEAPPEKK